MVEFACGIALLAIISMIPKDAWIGIIIFLAIWLITEDLATAFLVLILSPIVLLIAVWLFCHMPTCDADEAKSIIKKVLDSEL